MITVISIALQISKILLKELLVMVIVILTVSISNIRPLETIVMNNKIGNERKC